MTLLTQAVMVRANIDVDGMSAQQKVELADEIYVQQPNTCRRLLGASCSRYGLRQTLIHEDLRSSALLLVIAAPPSGMTDHESLGQQHFDLHAYRVPSHVLPPSHFVSLVG